MRGRAGQGELVKVAVQGLKGLQLFVPEDLLYSVAAELGLTSSR